MTSLYTNAKGYPVTLHSYSGGNEFKFCRRKYQLNRIKGWKERENKASKEFGNCIESALMYWHSNEMAAGSCASEFRRLWEKHKDANLAYTDKEGSFDDLMQMGSEMCKLYEIRWPSFGLSKPKFQLNYKKPVLPNSEFQNIEYTAFVDMRAERGPFGISENLALIPTPIIVDIKTSGVRFPDAPGMLRLDSQLKSYAWVTGISDVGFLVFVKTRPGFSNGDEVTSIDGDVTTLGKTATVLTIDDEEESDKINLCSAETFEEIKRQFKEIKGKGAKERKRQVLQTFFARDLISRRRKDCLTKQRIQFLTDTIPADDIKEAGQVIARDIVAIVQASKDDFFPKEGGMRFPDQKCGWCSYLGICTGNDKLRDEKLVQIGAAQKDLLADLGDE